MGYFTAFREDVYPRLPFATLHTDPEFSLTAAGSLAWAAQLAYEVDAQEKLDRIVAQWGWRDAGVFQRDFPNPWRRAQAKGFIAKAEKATIIAFAGTEPESVTDWQQDFTVWYAGSGVHQGFQDGVTAAWADIEAAAKGAAGGIYLTGHSLGAALAVVAAWRLVEQAVVPADSIRGVYTIGMPRAGNETFATAYDARLGARTFRLIHGDDLVTMVPPAGLGFRHVGRWLAAPRTGQFVGAPTDAPPPADTTPSLGDFFAGLVSNNAPAYPAANPPAIVIIARLPGFLRDHLPDGYLRALGVLA
jgi:triacylglycerol lipase